MDDRYCRNCGNELEVGDAFCSKCGTSIRDVAHVPTPEADVAVPATPTSRSGGQSPTGSAKRRMSRPVAIGAIVVLLIVVLASAGIFAVGGIGSVLGGTPKTNTAEVARAFEEEGLEVGEYYPVEDAPGWGTGMLPKTMESGTRVELPSYAAGQDPAIADVFRFSSSDDQKVLSDYLGGFNKGGGGMFYTHVYETNGFLLKIDGNVPQDVADKYGEVFEDTAR